MKKNDHIFTSTYHCKIITSMAVTLNFKITKTIAKPQQVPNEAAYTYLISRQRYLLPNIC